ncbi:hypothetical protein PMAYCL1PPCAC_27388, partial [Pristionchus mayeri]
ARRLLGALTLPLGVATGVTGAVHGVVWYKTEREARQERCATSAYDTPAQVQIKKCEDSRPSKSKIARKYDLAEDLSGKTYIVTGATSGIGQSEQCRSLR